MSDSSIGINHLIILNKNFKKSEFCVFANFRLKLTSLKKSHSNEMKSSQVKIKIRLSPKYENILQHNFFKWPKPGLFFIYFSLFKQTLPFLQKINVKNVHPEYGTRIQTHDCWNMSPSPITTRPGLPPFCNKMFDNLQ